MKSKTKIWLIIGVCLSLCVFFSGCFISKDATYSKVEVNQRDVINNVGNIIGNQVRTYRDEGRFATAEELQIERHQEKGYLIEMKSYGKSFQIWATPTEYPKTGKFSYYADSNDIDIHGADHKGEKSSNNDPVVDKNPDEWKELLRKQNDTR